MAKKSRKLPEVNASSMADIAFLLLIFFLVTTTIDVDKGIKVKLPPWSEIPPETQKLKERNVYSVLVNANNQLLVRGQVMDVADLRENAMRFISNRGVDPSLSESPNKAIISLKNDRGTKYDTYLTVYNELKAAYRELWDEESMNKYGVKYDDLKDEAIQESIRKEIPLVISEAEPTAFGEE